MDDTNPTKEDIEYVESIEQDVAWLGFHWAGGTLYAADYFQQMYDYAEQLIRMGKATWTTSRRTRSASIAAR